MSRSPVTPHAVGKCVAVASVVLVFACVRFVLAPGTQYSGEWNTMLPPGVNSDADAFRTHLRASPGVSHTRRRAGACPGCDVRVSIQSIADTRGIRPDSGPPEGLAVALIQNLDAEKTEGYYGFRPSTIADYYLWVDRRPDAAGARITVLEVPRSSGPVRAGKQKNLVYCHRWAASHYSEHSDADFVEYKPPCTAGSSANKSNTVEATFFSAALVERAFAAVAAALRDMTRISSGGWIDCNLGCCT